MQILITGSRGAIGKKLKARLPGALEIDRLLGFDLLTCDLPEVDVIYHLAAQTSVESSWQDPLFDSYNFNMMVRLVQRYPNARIIYSQSAASMDITSPYGFSKRVAGDYLKKFHKNYVICVFPNVFGQPKSVVDIFKDKKEVVIYGTGEHIRDYVHVDDIVEGLVKAKDWDNGEYFMGSGTGVSVLELAEGKVVTFLPERREQIESILPNTTPNWKPYINVKAFLNE